MKTVLRGLKPESLKKCCHCKNELPLNCIYKNKTKKDDLNRECNTCKNEYYKKNKDKLFPRVDCDCGKTIYNYYLEKHLKTKYHTQIV
jgi:hypothetical protein